MGCMVVFVSWDCSIVPRVSLFLGVGVFVGFLVRILVGLLCNFYIVLCLWVWVCLGVSLHGVFWWGLDGLCMVICSRYGMAFIFDISSLLCCLVVFGR